jgi:hypothetical protein
MHLHTTLYIDMHYLHMTLCIDMHQQYIHRNCSIYAVDTVHLFTTVHWYIHLKPIHVSIIFTTKYTLQQYTLQYIQVMYNKIYKQLYRVVTTIS